MGNLENLLDELGYIQYICVCVGGGGGGGGVRRAWLHPVHLWGGGWRSLGKWRVHVFGKVGGGGR